MFWKILRTETGFAKMRQYNSRWISRTYPKGNRFDSSNFDPIIHWYSGCQMVALNYQTCDAPMWINWAKFGRRGYILRPSWQSEVVPPELERIGKKLVGPDGERFVRPRSKFSKLVVKVLGARYLMRTGCSRTDPYVVVQLWDGSSRVYRFKTEAVVENAFNPNYKAQDMVFPILDSANSFLSITAYHDDKLIGFWCAKVENVREGYRVAHLRDSNYDRLNKGMGHVFAHFSIQGLELRGHAKAKNSAVDYVSKYEALESVPVSTGSPKNGKKKK